MEYIKRSHIEKYEFDRDHHWEKWLEINGQISEKYCNKSYLCSPYEEILFDLEYPKEDDKQVFYAANYQKNGFIPILLRGVVIDNNRKVYVNRIRGCSRTRAGLSSSAAARRHLNCQTRGQIQGPETQRLSRSWSLS